MYFITGDTHRDFSRVEELCNRVGTTKDDTMIVLGDAGINYWSGNSDRNLKRRLSDLPIKFFLIRGNHEIRPSDIPTYKTVNFCGGWAYIEDEFPDLVFAMDGQIYNLCGKRALVVGGAYSIDKQYRLELGNNWFSNEQLSEVEMDAILSGYKGYIVDYILSHTAPDSEIPYYLLPQQFAGIPTDKSMELWMDKLKQSVSYKKWFCGHFHIEHVTNNFEFMYKNIAEFT
jgi:3-oxoacid CoA-transferase subunit A